MMTKERLWHLYQAGLVVVHDPAERIEKVLPLSTSLYYANMPQRLLNAIKWYADIYSETSIRTISDLNGIDTYNLMCVRGMGIKSLKHFHTFCTKYKLDVKFYPKMIKRINQVP